MSDLFDLAWIISDTVQIQAQRQQIRDLQGRLALAHVRRDWSNLPNAREKRIEVLEQRVTELAHLCRGLISVLKESNAIDSEKLVAAMNKVSAEEKIAQALETPKPEVKLKKRPPR